MIIITVLCVLASYIVEFSARLGG